MDAVDSSPAANADDIRLIQRITVVLVFLIAFTAGFSVLYRTYATKIYDITGTAQWIWAPHRVSENAPVVFFAAREFDVPAARAYTHLKILGDPESTIYFNGREIASRRVAEDARYLEQFDLSQLARTGRNRLVIAVRSTNGVGGLIAAIDLGPEAENAIVTDGSWRIFRRWRDDLPFRDAPDEASQRPMLLGRPPAGRWNYLAMRQGGFEEPLKRVLKPLRRIDFVAEVPTVKAVPTDDVREGVQVAGAVRTRATAYDFNFTDGRIRFTLNGRQAVAPLIRFKLANTAEELTRVESQIYTMAFGEGEMSIVDPQLRHFRYVVILGRRATVEVVQ